MWRREWGEAGRGGGHTETYTLSFTLQIIIIIIIVVFLVGYKPTDILPCVDSNPGEKRSEVTEL